MHRRTTAEEILHDTDENVDIFIAGVGTGGTVSGVGAVLKELKPNVKVIAVQPAESPLPYRWRGRPSRDPGTRSKLRRSDL